MKLQMTSKYKNMWIYKDGKQVKRQINPVYEGDVVYLSEILEKKCIHCGKEYDKERNIDFVRQIGKGVFWWHARESCTPDDPEELKS